MWRRELLRRTGLVLALACLVAAAPAGAVSTSYQYTGNNFNIFAIGAYSPTDSVTGVFELNTGPLVGGLTIPVNLISNVVSFSFSDGVQTISNTTPGVGIDFFNNFTTDPFGNIVSWNIKLVVPTPNGDSYISTYSSTSSTFGIDDGCYTVASFCDNSARSGTLSGAITLLPEPATALLLGPGAVALAALRRRRVR